MSAQPQETHPNVDRPLPKTFFSRYHALLIAGSIVALVLVLAAWMSTSLSTNTVRLDKNTITVGTVLRGVLHDFLTLRLAVVPRDVVFIDAAEGGSVEKISVNPGDAIKAGQTLVTLSNPQLELQVLEHEGRLIESMTQVQNQQTMLAQTRLNNESALREIEFNIARLTRALARRATLVEQGIVSRESVEQLQDDLEIMKRKRLMQVEINRQQEELRRKQMPQISAQITSLQRDMEITRSKLANLTVRAPYDGRVISIDLKIGQTLRQGDLVTQVSRDTGFKLTQQIDEFYISRLRSGQTGTVDLGGSTWAVEVSRVYPEIRNGTFTVDLEFVDKAPVELRPGQTVQGKLTFGDNMDAVYMPAGAYLERSGGTWVFVLSRDGSSAVRRTVTTGRRNSEQVEVLSGLQPGDQILTSDYTGLDHADRVSIK